MMDFSLKRLIHLVHSMFERQPPYCALATGIYNLMNAMVSLNVFQIVFEAQRGKGVGGEIGLDNVVLTSGPCQEDVGPLY